MPVLENLEEQPGHQKTENSDGSISYNITYVATFDDCVSNAFAADILAGFSKGDVLSFANGLSLQSWVTKETDNCKVWAFDCTYTSATFDGSNPSEKIEIETFTWTETRERIVNNTVGDPMFPALQETEYLSGIRIIWNDTSIDMSDLNISGSVNNTQITVAGISVDPYCMKAGALEFNKITDGTNITYQKVLPLYFNFKKAISGGASHSAGDTIGFQKEVTNNGFRIYAVDGGPNDYLTKIVDEDGEEVTQPQRLDQFGTSLLTPSEDDWSILVTPTELDDFSSFNLPSNAPS